MARLFIIGNGFDLFHGLPTSTNAFRNYLDKIKPFHDLHSVLDEFEMCGVNWGELENSLAYFELDAAEAANVQYPDYLSERESDRDGTILNMQYHLGSLRDSVFEALDAMTNNANNQLYRVARRANVTFCANDAVVNFNYTSTLERLYEVPDECDILHIHGMRENGDPAIFGYKDPIKENCYRTTWFTGSELDGHGYTRDYYVDTQRSLLLEFYLEWRKPLQTKKLEDFIEDKEIDTVIVLGHSLSEVDRPYFATIDEVLKPKLWVVSQHDGSPNSNTLSKYPFYNRIIFFNFEQLVDASIEDIIASASSTSITSPSKALNASSI